MPVPHRQHRRHVVLRCLHHHLLLSQRGNSLWLDLLHIVELRRVIHVEHHLLLSERRLTLWHHVLHVVELRGYRDHWRHHLLLSQRGNSLGHSVHHVV